jgi:hypothetical protein
MKRLLLLPLLIIIFAACNDDDPVGPQTTTKVITFQVNAEDWEITDPIAAYEKEIPELTQDIAEKGAVIVYKRSVSDEVWTLWDISVTDVEAGYSYSFFSSYSAASLVLGVLKSGEADFPGVIKDNNIIKVILIKDAAAVALISSETIKNYDYLKEKLNLPE